MKKPHEPENEICFCPLFGLLDVVAKKWAQDLPGCPIRMRKANGKH